MTWSRVELREVQVFYALADELHFGRAAERLDVTPSRVSQILRELERKLGGELVSRSSRRVALTPLGERLLAESRSPYDALIATFRRIHAASHSLDGTLRVGLLGANSGAGQLTAIVAAFEGRHPECEVVVQETFFADTLGPLQRGEIDVLVTRLPIMQSDLVVGPVLAREPRVLAVAKEHPLADRDQVSIEDIADFDVAPITDTPKELIDTVVPRRTPSGRQIRRLTRRPNTPHEVTALVARGTIVHPTVPSFGAYYGQPGIVYVPIADMPPMKTGLVWRRRSSDSRLREFIRVTKETLAIARKNGASSGRAFRVRSA